MTYICFRKLENLQCRPNLRSLGNVKNEREMPQDNDRLGEMFMFAASFVKNPDTYTHIKII